MTKEISIIIEFYPCNVRDCETVFVLTHIKKGVHTFAGVLSSGRSRKSLKV